MLNILPGDPAHLGVTAREGGYNFALFSAHATRVELCLFDAGGEREIARVDLPEPVADVWAGFIPQLAPPFSYGYRVHGPWDPDAGHRFNHHKLLLDPYARHLVGGFDWRGPVTGHRLDGVDGQLHLCTEDSARYVPKALVQDSRPLRARPCTRRRDWAETLIWEVQVRAATLQHPQIDADERGRFTGLASRPVIDHLKSHGFTAVELMPVQSLISERHLFERGLSNVWGYNPLSFFAFNPAFAAGDPLADFCVMLDRFHEAGIEVIIDVVYNHSAESDHNGPTVMYRGLDNASYYRLDPIKPRCYINDTGCGNTFDAEHPIVQRLVLDNLRWLASLGVDGFRFDLGVTLGRLADGFHRDAPLWQAIVNDPILRTRKLITEPWDIGPGGYQLGRMPEATAEWNDRFRDTVRRAWRGDPGQVPEFARRLHGSADIFESHGRLPHCSVNYVASHDGASLADLVMYVSRHNQANGEDNCDGHGDNLSQNFGHEGPSGDPEVANLRGRTLRSLLASLLLAQGTPMITAGDEWGHSRRGNNNAYCQDNEINWLDWSAREADVFGLRGVLRTLSGLRQHYPSLWQDRFRHQHGPEVTDGIDWFAASGACMTSAEWERPDLQHFMMRVVADNGATDLLVAFNLSDAYHDFILPKPGGWRCVLDTAVSNTSERDTEALPAGSARLVLARSLQVFLSGVGV